MAETKETIGLGGGCHWCTEAVFQALGGISEVQQGFVKSDPPHDTFSEAVLVTFDPETLPVEILIEVHLRTHASTSNHTMRGKYRSAVYVYNGDQAKRVQSALDQLQLQFDESLVTQVLKMETFRPSPERYQNYYLQGPEKPFCRAYIDPKLALLRKEYGRLLQTGK